MKMKTVKFLVYITMILASFIGTSCSKDDEEDYSNFKANDLIGQWICPDSDANNEVYLYLDIKANTIEVWYNDSDYEGKEGAAYYKDGKDTEGEKVEWSSYGEYSYTFDEKEQTLFCNDMEIVEEIDEIIEIAALKRTGKDESIIVSSAVFDLLEEYFEMELNISRMYRIQ